MIDLIDLQNKESAHLIKDIVLYPLKINKDESGVLVETLRTDWSEIYGSSREFFMQYYSETPSGVARDENTWHYHPTIQDDRFSVVKGEIIVAVADNRSDSSTNGLLNLFYINARKDPYLLLIPRKTLHGFMVVSKEPAILINFPTGLYDPKEEERIPYSEAKIKLSDGSLFSWDLVRKNFQALHK
ncbi:dTDP-4-dehydrorhamnose 3,5-epimerase family protein [Patescibacteria group bacterium]|nr:dTDP-4-dehydrorhamnose 3,5-epimerase family protein [Patescibacteria group bacterium]